ncbi:MAG: D-alanine--D-alanine ligase [Mucilaginibacter polytrichastri]|nr:D-alanine--D-alanine ligase [Mucilaginibacter polytrichastri]
MTKKNVAVVAGGFTGEYPVSINSARNISDTLDPDRYVPFTILITRARWCYAAPDGTEVPVNRDDFTISLNGETIRFDVAFITIHGTPGEDGKMQGYFDMLGIPYTTCDATTSAITMNKAWTKALVKGIPDLHSAESVQLFEHDAHDVISTAARLRFPLFIKPNNGGSSVGMSKVHDVAALPDALSRAFAEDKQVLVEEFIGGREFSIGIASLHGKVTVLPATEIISSKEFFDYEAKYTPGVSHEITPADLNEEQLHRIENIVRAVYRRLNCRGMVRVDFILQKETGYFYFIEINTTPGQSANSLIPQQVRATGMSLQEFYGILVDDAMRAVSR